jgi:hypothetical protein
MAAAFFNAPKPWVFDADFEARTAAIRRDFRVRTGGATKTPDFAFKRRFFSGCVRAFDFETVFDGVFEADFNRTPKVRKIVAHMSMEHR